MFAYALWDEVEQELLCARDRFGIKPFYYAQVGDVLYFASEAKALLPFLPRIETDLEGLKDYLAFQFCLAGKTLFEGVRELLPGHRLRVRNGDVGAERYWEVYYDLDFDHTAKYFEERIEALLEESVRLHLRSDVPVAAYLSGGLDSSQRRVARQPQRQRGDEGVHRPLPRGRALRRERATRRRSPTSAASTCSVVDIDADDFLGYDRAGHLPPRLPGRRPRLVPAVHGLAGRRARRRR